LLQTGGFHADALPMQGTSRTMMISRAVIRQVEPGNTANCAHCGAPIKFAARLQLRQVIANVYQEGSWVRVEHYHADCYDEADQPYGPPAVKS
jgi:hypothetical protein